MIVETVKKISLEFISGDVEEYVDAQVTFTVTEIPNTDPKKIVRYYQITIPVEVPDVSCG